MVPAEALEATSVRERRRLADTVRLRRGTRPPEGLLGGRGVNDSMLPPAELNRAGCLATTYPAPPCTSERTRSNETTAGTPGRLARTTTRRRVLARLAGEYLALLGLGGGAASSHSAVWRERWQRCQRALET